MSLLGLECVGTVEVSHLYSIDECVGQLALKNSGDSINDITIFEPTLSSGFSGLKH